MVLLLGLSGCASSPGSPPAEPDVTVTSSVAASGDPRTLTLHQDVQALAAQVPGELGFVLLDPHGREAAAVNADRSFTSASLYKLFVAEAVLEQVDEGRIGLSDVVPGLDITVDEAIEEMITWSRNYPGAAIGAWLGWDEIEATAHSHGLDSTTFDPDNGMDDVVEMTTTPEDVSGFLQALNDGELLGSASSAVLLGHLADQHLDYALPQGLSPDVQFDHKTGLLEDVSHEAGILRLNERDYVVAILTD
ncbi:serine hydrolase [Kocuria rosea]|uniref:serine hydrolase n=1 Tax=Kocuria rosea TaxID=1275 RepID=UPI001407707B|nr:serine hydrolase [Kocuria rosea]